MNDEPHAWPVLERDIAVHQMWEKLLRAVFFINTAQNRLGEIPAQWCWEIAAESLWSTVQIFNSSVAANDERLGDSRGATRWYRERGRDEGRAFVDRLRNGAVHLEGHPYGYGESVGPGEQHARFMWFGMPDEGHSVPIEEVPTLLLDVAERIAKHLMKTIPEYGIPVGAPGADWLVTVYNSYRESRPETLDDSATGR